MLFLLDAPVFVDMLLDAPVLPLPTMGFAPIQLWRGDTTLPGDVISLDPMDSFFFDEAGPSEPADPVIVLSCYSSSEDSFDSPPPPSAPVQRDAI